MKLRYALSIWIAVFGIAAFLGAPLGSWASNRWGCYKYANYDINWYNGGTGDYYNIYNEEAKPTQTPGVPTRTFI